MDNSVEKKTVEGEDYGSWEFPDPEVMDISYARLVNDCALAYLESEDWPDSKLSEKYPALPGFLFSFWVNNHLVYDDLASLAQRLKELRSAELSLQGSGEICIVGGTLKKMLDLLKDDPELFDTLSKELSNRTKE